jgi:tetratricopeptide (TPR) repeat protein
MSTEINLRIAVDSDDDQRPLVHQQQLSDHEIRFAEDSTGAPAAGDNGSPRLPGRNDRASVVPTRSKRSWQFSSPHFDGSSEYPSRFDRLLQLIFLALILLQFFALVAVFILAYCLAASTLEAPEEDGSYAPRQGLCSLIPRESTYHGFVGAVVSWFATFAAIRYCLPARVKVLWHLSHAAAAAAEGFREGAAHASNVTKTVFSRAQHPQSPAQLLSWAQALSSDEQQEILSRSQELYEAQQWERALMQGRTLAVVRAIQTAHEPLEAEPERDAHANESDSQQLVGMGFPESRARKALQVTGGNVQLAMDWLLRHEVDTDIRVPMGEDCRHTAQDERTAGDNPCSAAGWKCSCGVTVAPEAQARNTCAWKKEPDAQCDGCSAGPIVGLRWKCTECADFDFCDACHSQLQAGVRKHTEVDTYDAREFFMTRSLFFVMYDRFTNRVVETFQHDFREVSAHGGSCCNCALHLRGWTRSHFESWACSQCKARRASEVLSKIGIAHKHLGEYASAVEVLEERLEIVKLWGDRDGESDAHDHLAACFRSMGLFDRALSHAQQQLRLAHERGRKRAEAVALQRVAECYESQGEYALAIGVHEQCLAIAGELEGEQCVLKLRSNVRNRVPAWSRSRRSDTFAPVTLQEHKCKIFEAYAHQNLANCYYHEGKYSRAFEHHDKALAIVAGRTIELSAELETRISEYRLQQKHRTTWRDDAGWARLHGASYGDVSAGHRVRELEQQLKSIFLGDKHLEGEVCAGLGRCHERFGQYRRAIELHHQHLDIAKDAGDKASQATACNDLGNALHQLGDHAPAAQVLVRGLMLHQRVERDVGWHDDRRVSLFELQQAGYAQLQGVLLHMRHAQWALGVCAQAKARALAHKLEAGSGSHTKHHPADSSTPGSGLVSAASAVLRASAPQVAGWRQHPSCGSHSEEDGLYTDICESWWEEVRGLARLEGAATRVVEFSFVSDDRMAVWVLSGEGELLGSVTVPSTGLNGTKGRTIQLVLAEARRRMNVRGRDCAGSSRQDPNMVADVAGSDDHRAKVCRLCECRPCVCAKEKAAAEQDRALETALLRELYQTLLQPVESHLRIASELLIIPHKELFEVPWAALIDAQGRYLVELFVIRVAPSLRVARQAADCIQESVGQLSAETGVQATGEVLEGPGHGHVVVVGNPLPIPRMFRALPFAEEEAVEVKDMLNKAGVVVRDFFRADQHPQATKAALVQSLQGAKLAHIACHADIDTDSLVLAIPSDNLSDDNSLTNLSMKEVQGEVQLAKGSTVVLSACNTGRGQIKAEGVVGMSRGFLLAGAASTVVSLWSVDDRSTRALFQVLTCHAHILI